MIRSMTAYAQRKINGKWGSVVWEICSVNQRYLEIHFRSIPEEFRNLEFIIRDRIRARLTRGKIECNLRFKPHNNMQSKIILNEKLVKRLVNAAHWVKMQSNLGEINLIDILRWPGVMIPDDPDLNSITAKILIAFDNTLNDFIIARKTEGKALKEIIEQYLKKVRSNVDKIRINMPEILQWQRKRLVEKLEEAKVKLENNRLEQELILIAQRADVSEELDRLTAHVNETYNILKKQEAIGRHLDFMMQEFNRESNTLASKSINTEVTNASIEIKVLIEKMREQIQNVE